MSTPVLGAVHLLAAAGATGGTPSYAAGVGWFVWVEVLIKVLVAFAVLMGSVIMMIWFERKLISDMQSRIGPNRAGPWGLLQTLADGIKLFFKEDLLPERADSFVFKLAPYLALDPGPPHLHDRPRRRGDHNQRPPRPAAGGRPPDRDPARARDVVDRASTA